MRGCLRLLLERVPSRGRRQDDGEVHSARHRLRCHLPNGVRLYGAGQHLLRGRLSPVRRGMRGVRPRMRAACASPLPSLCAGLPTLCRRMPANRRRRCATSWVRQIVFGSKGRAGRNCGKRARVDRHAARRAADSHMGHRYSRGPMEASPFAIAATCATSSIFRYAIGSTHCVRHAGAVNGSAKYCVSWDTLSPLNSMMLTV